MTKTIFTDPKTGKQIALYDAETWTYKSRGQKQIAESKKALYIFVRGDERGYLPKWVIRALNEHGLYWKKIGRTTYKSNTYCAYSKVI